MPYPVTRRRKAELTAESADSVRPDRADPARLVIRFTSVTGIDAVRGRTLWAKVSRSKVADMIEAYPVTDPELKAAVQRVTGWLRSRP